ncbi:hypothetical protein IDM40_05350 [Nocardiopsis sp. HNM0947]|uniref:Secreted protein n=1 Tax=Nocardiopsis coralli TaxID=2772213 RepID=A0ABR9P2R4_9ACTN|nr:DUF6049 family protein [Nocardiopsis coralli]MBE2998134.1 hypothetical protein [Nocardiopsis coralli]
MVMALTTALLPIPGTLPPAAAEPDEDTVDPLVVDSITPDVVDEDATLRVSGQVTNTTDEEVSEVSVRMRYSRHPFSDRGELDEFAAGDGWQPDATGPEEDVSEELAPDAGQGYALSTDVDELGLSGYGVFPMMIEAVDGDGTVIGSQYTFLPHLDPDDEAPEIDLAWVWPLMDTPQRADDDTFLTDSLPESLEQQGRLGRLLASGAQVPLDFDPGDDDLPEDLGLETAPEEEEPEEGSPEEDEATNEETAESEPTDDASPTEDDTEEPEDEEEPEPTRTEGVPVTWAVDPGTLDDIARAASDDFEVLDDVLAIPAESDPVRHDHEADEAAQVWLREARRVLPADTVAASPYANPDLAAMLRNDIDTDAEASVRIGREATMEALELAPDESYALPPGGLMDDSVHELLSEAGADRFILDGSAMPPVSWLSTTPSAQDALPSPTGDGEDVALLSDPGLTEVLSMPSETQGDSALALQRFAAETAMIAGENTGGDRVVVASPEAQWDPGEEFASGVLEATESLPWLNPENLDDVELPPEDEREDTRGDLTYPESAYDTELSSTYLGQIQDVNRDVRMFNSILVEDNDPFRPALLRLSSAYWRDEEALAGAMRSLVAQDVQDGLDSVRIIPGEPVTLASRTGITGILVANDLEDESVFVTLSVFSENSERLTVESYTDSFEIAPGAKTTVYVPLSARVNGRTVLHTSLHNSAGEPINAQDTEIPVNATGLGTQALLISGIGVLILVAALAPRAVRKWARSSSKSSAAAAAAGGAPGDGDGETPEGEESSQGTVAPAGDDTEEAPSEGTDGGSEADLSDGEDTDRAEADQDAEPSEADRAPDDDTSTPSHGEDGGDSTPGADGPRT